MSIRLLVSLPLILINRHLPRLPGLFGLIGLAPLLMYAVSQKTLYPRRWIRHYASAPILTLIGIGIALNNTWGVLEALFRVDNVFRRTPKFSVEGRDDRWLDSQYALPLDGMVVSELALTLYALTSAMVALWFGDVQDVPFLSLYVLGFGYFSFQGLWDARLDLVHWLRQIVESWTPSS